MLNVFITVDTEVSTYGPRWCPSRIDEDIDRDILGVTVNGQFGVPYQIDVLNRYGLKAVFFVEALFACVAGLDPLQKMVQMVQDGGHEVQLHLHTEWLTNMPVSILPGRKGNCIKDFSEDEQVQLITQGLKNLQASGARNICAFRAGDYGANFDTLRALARTEVLYDTSYNECYLDSTCGMERTSGLVQPRLMEGVYEFPVACFRDFPGHCRHAQLCACSSQELEHALMAAWKRGWDSFVIVSHSFELIRRARQPGERTVPDRVVIQRFERLCRFLAGNGDKFRTAMFSQLDPSAIVKAAPSQALSSGIHYTVQRWSQQFYRRLLLQGAR
jgi:hypothetical protein